MHNTTTALLPNIRTLDDLDIYLTAAMQTEDAAKWATGDALVAAIEHGLAAQLGGVRALLEYAGVAIGRGWRTMHRRRVAAETFPPETRSQRPAWETYCRIAELAGSDETIDPLEWLAIAADNEYTAEQIEAAIKQTHADAQRGQRVYVLRGAAAVVEAVGNGRIVLVLARDVDVQAGQDVTVTLAYEDEPAAQE